jgi:hypothetical protein
MPSTNHSWQQHIINESFDSTKQNFRHFMKKIIHLAPRRSSRSRLVVSVALFLGNATDTVFFRKKKKEPRRGIPWSLAVPGSGNQIALSCDDVGGKSAALILMLLARYSQRRSGAG